MTVWEQAVVQEACKHQLLAKETTDVSSLHSGVTSGSSTLPWASITEIVVRYRHRRRQKRITGVSITQDCMTIWLIMGFINISA